MVRQLKYAPLSTISQVLMLVASPSSPRICSGCYPLSYQWPVHVCYSFSNPVIKLPLLKVVGPIPHFIACRYVIANVELSSMPKLRYPILPKFEVSRGRSFIQKFDEGPPLSPWLFRKVFLINCSPARVHDVRSEDDLLMYLDSVQSH